MIIGEGAGHGIWKMIEAERERWLAVKRAENTLREFLIHGLVGATADAMSSYLLCWFETRREATIVGWV